MAVLFSTRELSCHFTRYYYIFWAYLLLLLHCFSNAEFMNTPPVAGGAGRAAYFSATREHKPDMMTWMWDNTPKYNHTIEFWMKVIDFHQNYHSVFTYAVFDETQVPMYMGTYEMAYEISFSDASVYQYLQFGDGCTARDCTLQKAIANEGAWFHYAVTIDRETVTYFTNGAAVRSNRIQHFDQADNGPIISGGMGMLGAYGINFAEDIQPDLKADAIFDEFRIWDYARSFEQLANSFRVRMLPGTPGLLLLFDWDDSDGDDTLVQDESGNGNVAEMGRVVWGANVITFDGDPTQIVPTSPVYKFGTAPLAGAIGSPIVVGVRPAPFVNVLHLIGADADGDALSFTLASQLTTGGSGAATDSIIGAIVRPFGSGTPLQVGDVISDSREGESTDVVSGGPRVEVVLGDDVTLPSDWAASFRYNVSDGVAWVEGVVRLRPWVMPQPPNMTLSGREDEPIALTLSQTDEYGNTLSAVIVVRSHGNMTTCPNLPWPAPLLGLLWGNTHLHVVLAPRVPPHICCFTLSQQRFWF